MSGRAFTSVSIVALLMAAAAWPQTAPTAVNVDATAQGVPLNPVWSWHGYDEANYTTQPEGVQLLRDVKAMNPESVFVRTHFLLNSGDGTPALKWGSTNVYTEDAQGKPVYDFKLLDGILDTITRIGAFPEFEIAFMPQALSSKPVPYKPSSTTALDGGSFYPPADYAKWAGLIRAVAAHAQARYPGMEGAWPWELWNEPDIGYWHGTHAEYLKLFDYTEQALHAVLPKAVLGGPEVTGGGTGMMREFLDHCAAGTNAATGAKGTRLDMITFHAKGGVALSDGHVRMDLGNQLRQHRTFFSLVAGYPQYRAKPIVIGEADPDGCAACSAEQIPADAYRNVPAYGAYEAAMMKHSLDLADSLRVNLRGMVTWAWTFPGSPYFSGYRELANGGIHKPVLETFKMLGLLRGRRIPLMSEGARGLADILANGVRGAPDIDGMASRDGDRIAILLWNYHDEITAAPDENVRLSVSLPSGFPAQAKVTHYRMDSTHSNAYTAWLAMGKPQPPNAAQLAELKAAMALGTLEPPRNVAVTGGKLGLDFAMPRHAVSLVLIENPASTAVRPGTRSRARTPEAGRGRPGIRFPVPRTGGWDACDIRGRIHPMSHP